MLKPAGCLGWPHTAGLHLDTFIGSHGIGLTMVGGAQGIGLETEDLPTNIINIAM